MSTTLGAKAVGDIVQLKENGELVHFLIIHKGNPDPSLYHNADGVWLLRFETGGSRQWNSSQNNDYENSQIHSYLNDELDGVLAQYESSIKNAIMTVKIPYRLGNNNGTVINSGENGLSCKVFSLSADELGEDVTYGYGIGTKLDYFYAGTGTTAQSQRSSDSACWTRTPNKSNNSYSVAIVGASGSLTHSNATSYINIRQAFVLPSSTVVSSFGPIYANEAPVMGAISVASEIIGGQNTEIKWVEATDNDGNLEGYTLERSIDGGAWVQIYKGSGLNTTNMVEFGVKTVQYRVQAYDSVGATSSYKTSAIVTVINNTPPQISDTDRDLGEFSASFTLNYTVTDAEDGVVTVAESVNDTEIKAYEVVSGAENTVNFAYNDWAKIPNGIHGFTITAADSVGAEAQRNYSFNKSETQIHLEYAEALESENPAVVGILTVEKEMAEGALFSVEVCNNGFDEVPTWEIVTSAVVNGGRFYLNNATKTAEKWGFNVRIKMDRNGATGDCWIGKVSGFFR